MGMPSIVCRSNSIICPKGVSPIAPFTFCHLLCTSKQIATRHVPWTGFLNGDNTLKQHFVLPLYKSKHSHMNTFKVVHILRDLDHNPSLIAMPFAISEILQLLSFRASFQASQHVHQRTYKVWSNWVKSMKKELKRVQTRQSSRCKHGGQVLLCHRHIVRHNPRPNKETVIYPKKRLQYTPNNQYNPLHCGGWAHYNKTQREASNFPQ